MSGRSSKQATSRGVGQDDVRHFRAAQGNNRPSLNQCNPVRDLVTPTSHLSLTYPLRVGDDKLPRNIGDSKLIRAGLRATAVG